LFALGQRGQAIDALFGHQDDAAAVAPVAAVGPAAGDIFLAAEADAAVTPFAPLDVNLDFINEHKGVVRNVLLTLRVRLLRWLDLTRSVRSTILASRGA
jgi:hypothetical protein